MIRVNGQEQNSVTITDRGLQYGDGLFETLPVRRGKPLFLKRHLARLRTGCLRLGIPYPDPSLLQDECASLCRTGPDAVLKIILTRGSGGRGYRSPEDPDTTRILRLYDPPVLPPQLRHGVQVRLCRTGLGINPALAGIKHLNRLEQVLARSEWRDGAIFEGLMCDSEGYLVEGTMSNVFMVKNQALYTPLIDRCGVAGILRALIIELAKDHGWAVHETRLKPDDLSAAEELFLSNSLIRILPISRLEGQAYPVGPRYRQMLDWIETAERSDMDVV